MEVTNIKQYNFDKKKYKEILLNTMKRFIKLCEEHNINYFGSGGTVLGAVRHQGLIPWDDDIDVYMLRNDYEKFLSLKNQIKGSGFEICTIDDKNYYLPYAKFCNANTTIWERKDLPYIMGVFIDIFPLDECNGDVEQIRNKRKTFGDIFEKYFYSIKKLDTQKVIEYWKSGYKKRCLAIIKEFTLLHMPGNQDYYKKNVLDYIEMIKGGKGNFLFHIFFTYDVEKEIFKKEWFEDYIELPFEDFKIRVAKGYKEYLIQMFGDYMTPPPPEKQKSRHFHYFVDLDKRYSLAEIKKLKL